MLENIINYKDSHKKSFLAQGKDKSFISLKKLDAPFKRFDGKRVSYEMDYRWLSTPCEKENDESWCCVQGNEFTYWTAKELTEMGLKLNCKNPVPENFNIFEHVVLM